MKNVLMIGPDRSVHGGISGVVNGYFEAGLDEKVNLRYIGTMKEGSKIKKLLVALGAYFKFLFSLGWADVVHVHVASDNSFLRKALFIRTAHRHHKKIIIHQHGGDFPNWYGNLGEQKKEYVRSVCKMADVMYVLSPTWKDFFEKLRGENNLEILPNAIRISEDGLSTEKRPHQMLFLGRICKTKGIAELMECMESVISEIPDVTLLLGGIWEDESLRTAVERYPQNVKYIGWVSRSEKQKYLNESAIYVLPTYFEGQPVSVLEAMDSGCLVVASDVGGIPMMIQNGVSGILVPPKDVEALKKALITACIDDENRRLMAEQARITVRKNYNLNNTIERLVKKYDEITTDSE